jgi:hypothetical protein
LCHAKPLDQRFFESDPSSLTLERVIRNIKCRCAIALARVKLEIKLFKRGFDLSEFQFGLAGPDLIARNDNLNIVGSDLHVAIADRNSTIGAGSGYGSLIHAVDQALLGRNFYVFLCRRKERSIADEFDVER